MITIKLSLLEFVLSLNVMMSIWYESSSFPEFVVLNLDGMFAFSSRHLCKRLNASTLPLVVDEYLRLSSEKYILILRSIFSPMTWWKSSIDKFCRFHGAQRFITRGKSWKIIDSLILILKVVYSVEYHEWNKKKFCFKKVVEINQIFKKQPIGYCYWHIAVWPWSMWFSFLWMNHGCKLTMFQEIQEVDATPHLPLSLQNSTPLISHSKN